MNPTRTHPLPRSLPPVETRHLLTVAIVVAVALLGFFVHVLEQAVLRGQNARLEQRAAASVKSTDRDAAQNLLTQPRQRARQAMPVRHAALDDEDAPLLR